MIDIYGIAFLAGIINEIVKDIKLFVERKYQERIAYQDFAFKSSDWDNIRFEEEWQKFQQELSSNSWPIYTDSVLIDQVEWFLVDCDI